MEYGADDAFILAVDGEIGASPSLPVVLKHLKSRNGETRDIRPDVRPAASAVHVPPGPPGRPTPQADEGKLTAALRAMWDRTAPAHDGDGEDDA